jgi:hypothetical protein
MSGSDNRCNCACNACSTVKAPALATTAVALHSAQDTGNEGQSCACYSPPWVQPKNEALARSLGSNVAAMGGGWHATPNIGISRSANWSTTRRAARYRGRRADIKTGIPRRGSLSLHALHAAYQAARCPAAGLASARRMPCWPQPGLQALDTDRRSNDRLQRRWRRNLAQHGGGLSCRRQRTKPRNMELLAHMACLRQCLRHCRLPCHMMVQQQAVARRRC